MPCGQTDGRTDRTKLTVAFRNFASWPKKTGNLGAFVQKHCCSRTAIIIIIITYSECVSVALVIQYAIPMRHISSAAGLALQYFFTLSHKRHIFGKKCTERRMCVLIFSTTFV